jgi:hypothetical protein
VNNVKDLPDDISTTSLSSTNDFALRRGTTTILVIDEKEGAEIKVSEKDGAEKDGAEIKVAEEEAATKAAEKDGEDNGDKEVEKEGEKEVEKEGDKDAKKDVDKKEEKEEEKEGNETKVEKVGDKKVEKEKENEGNGNKVKSNSKKARKARERKERAKFLKAKVALEKVAARGKARRMRRYRASVRRAKSNVHSWSRSRRRSGRRGRSNPRSFSQSFLVGVQIIFLRIFPHDHVSFFTAFIIHITLRSHFINVTQIFVKTLNGITIMMRVCPHDSVASLKKQIEERDWIPSRFQRLSYGARCMDDHQTMSQCGIRRESTIHVTMRLCGGMNRGLSLNSSNIYLFIIS